MLRNYVLNIPPQIKIIVLKNLSKKYKNIYLLSQNKKYIICVKKDNYFLDKWSNSIIFENKLIKQKIEKINNIFLNFLYSWDSFFFGKIKFKGKGFRIKFYKKNKIIKFFFGKSHKTFLFLKKIRRKKINKYKFILSSIKKDSVEKNLKIITNIKPINVYTLRGLRCSKQIIYKRKGKKGTYI